MINESVWDTFHGRDLEKLLDIAHSKLPDDYSPDNIKVDFLNNEYIVTVHASEKYNYYYKTYYECPIFDDDGSLKKPALLQLNDDLRELWEDGRTYEVVKICETQSNQGNDKSKDAWMLVKIYDL